MGIGPAETDELKQLKLMFNDAQVNRRSTLHAGVNGRSESGFTNSHTRARSMPAITPIKARDLLKAKLEW